MDPDRDPRTLGLAVFCAVLGVLAALVLVAGLIWLGGMACHDLRWLGCGE